MDYKTAERIRQTEQKIATELRALHEETGLMPDSVQLNSRAHRVMSDKKHIYHLDGVVVYIRASL